MHSRASTVARAGLFPRRRGWWRLVLLVIILLTVAGYISPVRSYLERSNQIAYEKENTAVLKQERDRLQTEKDRLQNQVYVEQVARKNLGLVKPGEQPYVLKNVDRGDEAEVAPAAPQEKSFIDSLLDAASDLLP